MTERAGWLHLALLVVGCQAKGPETPAPSPAATESAAAARPSFAFDAIVDSAIRDLPKPAAVVVLGLDDQRVLALGRHGSADPAKTAVRPGSTVKPLTAWVASRAGVLTSEYRVECGGKYAPIDGLSCFGSHGSLGLVDAIAISCNVYFFDLGQKLGFERVRAGFDALGFGKLTRLASDEVGGLLPTLAWMDAHPETGLSRERSLERRAAAIAIGHGPFEVTPLQLAGAYSILAKVLLESRGKVETEIMDGLRRVVQGADGTGKRAAVAGLDVVGKTGTAESTPFGVEADDSKENGWFVGFAPADKPEILVAVLTVKAGSGGEAAAPVAGRIFREWHQQR